MCFFVSSLANSVYLPTPDYYPWCLFGFLGQSFFVKQLWLFWNLLCRSSWPRTQRSACICLPSARVNPMYHHTLLLSLFKNLTLDKQKLCDIKQGMVRKMGISKSYLLKDLIIWTLEELKEQNSDLAFSLPSPGSGTRRLLFLLGENKIRQSTSKRSHSMQASVWEWYAQGKAKALPLVKLFSAREKSCGFYLSPIFTGTNSQLELQEKSNLRNVVPLLPNTFHMLYSIWKLGNM